ncbi:MAG TPA: Hsp20/alpha crystallin family protein [Acidimicrobiales bacterium]
MLLRFDPFRTLDRFTEPAGGLWRSSSMPMDAYRRGDEVVVHLDIPGVDPESIDLTVERNVLTVSARREWSPQEGDEVLVSERPQGSFTRQLFLGESLALEDVHAEYEQGVLTISVPVAEQAKPRRVEIGGGRPGSIEAGSQEG